MKKLSILSFVFAIICTVSNAESEKENCAKIAPPMITASDAMAGLGTALMGIDYTEIEGKFSGAEADAFRRLAVAQLAMKPEFDEYLSALEDAAMLMRKCAR